MLYIIRDEHSELYKMLYIPNILFSKSMQRLIRKTDLDDCSYDELNEIKTTLEELVKRIDEIKQSNKENIDMNYINDLILENRNNISKATLLEYKKGIVPGEYEDVKQKYECIIKKLKEEIKMNKDL